MPLLKTPFPTTGLQGACFSVDLRLVRLLSGRGPWE